MLTSALDKSDPLKWLQNHLCTARPLTFGPYDNLVKAGVFFPGNTTDLYAPSILTITDLPRHLGLHAHSPRPNNRDMTCTLRTSVTIPLSDIQMYADNETTHPRKVKGRAINLISDPLSGLISEHP